MRGTVAMRAQRRPAATPPAQRIYIRQVSLRSQSHVFANNKLKGGVGGWRGDGQGRRQTRLEG